MLFLDSAYSFLILHALSGFLIFSLDSAYSLWILHILSGFCMLLFYDLAMF